MGNEAGEESNRPGAAGTSGGGLRRTVESLGWLTESTVMPKKHKAIEGVGAASIVELKAQLYRTQEEVRKSKADDSADFHRAKRKSAASDVLSAKNSGVDARANKDKLEMKAEKDGTVVYAALVKKAELYEMLAQGNLPDEEEREKYCVDFFRKSIENHEHQPLEKADATTTNEVHEDEDAPADAASNSRHSGLGRVGTTIDKDEHKRFIREVHDEASEARQKASTLKLRREEQKAACREKLRQAYLRKQLAKLMAVKQPPAGDGKS